MRVADHGCFGLTDRMAERYLWISDVHSIPSLINPVPAGQERLLLPRMWSLILPRCRFPTRRSLVCFDPPHFVRNGKSGWVGLKYGTLNRKTWREDLRAGLQECFRVLKPNGTL